MRLKISLYARHLWQHRASIPMPFALINWLLNG